MSVFIDTNILVYAASSDPKKACAQSVIAAGGMISAQILNEFTVVARRKLAHDWIMVERAVALFRQALDPVLPLTEQTHAQGLALARAHNLAFYDALIVASALEAGCDTLWTEDLQDGRAFGALIVRNPFAA